MAASKSPQLRLLHIRDEIDGVMEALRDVSFDEYCKSFTLRRAAERAVQIVSEAAKALPPELTEEIWAAVVKVVRAAMSNAKVTAKDIAGFGITNQRETTIVWECAA